MCITSGFPLHPVLLPPLLIYYFSPLCFHDFSDDCALSASHTANRPPHNTRVKTSVTSGHRPQSETIRDSFEYYFNNLISAALKISHALSRWPLHLLFPRDGFFSSRFPRAQQHIAPLISQALAGAALLQFTHQQNI